VAYLVKKRIHVLRGAERDWIVQEEHGREFGHYPTRQEAEAVGYKLARKRGVELIVQDERGATNRSRPRKSWWALIFGR
jgi:hypothetical protein